MNKLFNINDITACETSEDKSDKLQHKFTRIHEHKLNNVKDLFGEIPKPDEIFFLWTVNSFNAYTFIPYLINQAGNINELIISTYSINNKIINALVGFLNNGQVDSIYILISDSAKFRIPKVVDHLEQTADSQIHFHVKYAWNHSKVTLLRSSDNHFVIEGSGNYSDNSRHEQYIFLNSKKVFYFRKNWIINDIHGKTT